MPKRYHEKIVIGNGGIVANCDNCKTLTGLRFVTETRNVAPGSPESFPDTHTYRLCDDCADREKAEYVAGGAEMYDGRPAAETENRAA